MSKFHFIPDQELCWSLLEYNQDLSKLYPNHMCEGTDNPVYVKYIESVLYPGEQYTLLDNQLYDYAITSFGRIINCKTKNEVGGFYLAERTNDIRINLRQSQLLLSKVFAENNWKFEFKKLTKDIKQRNLQKL
jgi:hypothetical protein